LRCSRQTATSTRIPPVASRRHSFANETTLGALRAGQRPAFVADEELDRARTFLHHEGVALAIIYRHATGDNLLCGVATGEDGREARDRSESGDGVRRAASRYLEWVGLIDRLRCTASIENEAVIARISDLGIRPAGNAVDAVEPSE